MKRKAASEQANDEDASGRAAEFAAHLKALNSQFASWVRTQAAEHGDELWIDGARAYARQAEALLREFDDALGGDGGGDATPAAGTSGGKQPKGTAFTFGSSAAVGASSSAAAGSGSGDGFLFGGGGGTGSGAAAAPSGGFMFGSAAAGSSTPGGGSGGGFTFGATTPSSSGTPAADGGTPGAASTPSIFAFGGATASSAGHTPAPAKFAFSGGGGFGAAAAGSSPAPGGFSFPAAAANGGGAADGGGEDGGGDAEEGPKSFIPEITVDEERYEVLFTSKSKLNVMKKTADGAATWESRGLGSLSIRRFKQGGDKKPYIFFTTDAGKSLVMSPILESTKYVKPSGGGVNAKRVSAYLQARDEELPQPGANAPPPSEPKYSYQNCMFTLGSAEKVAEFTAEVDNLKPNK